MVEERCRCEISGELLSEDEVLISRPNNPLEVRIQYRLIHHLLHTEINLFINLLILLLRQIINRLQPFQVKPRISQLLQALQLQLLRQIRIRPQLQQQEIINLTQAADIILLHYADLTQNRLIRIAK